jgi:hypothetical protein
MATMPTVLSLIARARSRTIEGIVGLVARVRVVTVFVDIDIFAGPFLLGSKVIVEQFKYVNLGVLISQDNQRSGLKSAKQMGKGNGALCIVLGEPDR